MKLWSRKVSRVTLLYPVNLFRIAELDSPQLDFVTMAYRWTCCMSSRIASDT